MPHAAMRVCVLCGGSRVGSLVWVRAGWRLRVRGLRRRAGRAERAAGRVRGCAGGRAKRAPVPESEDRGWGDGAMDHGDMEMEGGASHAVTAVHKHTTQAPHGHF